MAWLVPTARLTLLPGKRAAALATAADLLVRAAPSPDELDRVLPPGAARDAKHDLEEAARIATHPDSLERQVQRRWAAEFAAVIVGAAGARALWRKPRYWRTLTLAGLVAFAATVNLYGALELLWRAGGSMEVLATLFRLQPSAILTHGFAPLVITVCLAYLALSLRPRPPSPARPERLPPT